MDDTASNENPSKDFNKLDLTQLQGFSFGTQWTQDKGGAQEGRQDDRPRRDDDRRRDSGAPGDPKRDRRGFRKPIGSSADAPVAPRNEMGAPARGDFRGGPRREGPVGEYRGGPQRDSQGGPRGDFRGGPRGDFRGGPREGGYPERDRGPYISPFFNVIFYPEDVGFAALAKAIRSSCRTYELFEIARVIIGKNDRFIAVIQRRSPAEVAANGAGEQGSSASEIPTVKSAPMAISIPDGVPFESEDAAIAHVMTKHLSTFFDVAEIEIEPPKGSYQVINKCSITGELLGPPNYHRYNQIVAQHHANHISRMSLESYRSRIETVRDPEVVAQWLNKMKKATRYTWKLAPAGETAPAVDSLEEARMYLLTHAKDKVVKLVESARFHGKLLELLPPGEIHRSLEGALERQRRFPLDTANALRGRLRREGFTIFKKGSKGVSYVCAVKRKFRVPGQTFADTIGALISFIEAHPMIKASELPAKFLGIQPPAAPAPASSPEGSTVPPIQNSGTIPPLSPEAATALTAEDQSKLNRLNGDLRWLVTEGYVTEFIDGRLFAAPAMTEARKQEVEKDEHDPENFPEVPQTTPPMAVRPAPVASESVAPAADAVTAPAESAPVAVEPAAPAAVEEPKAE